MTQPANILKNNNIVKLYKNIDDCQENILNA